MFEDETPEVLTEATLEAEPVEPDTEAEPEADEYALVYDKDRNLLLGWDPEQGLYETENRLNDENLAENVREFLKIHSDFYDGGSIRVTPEGPFLAGDEFDAASVAWALNTLYGSDIEIQGTLPTMADLGLDAKSDINEDGTPAVR